LIGPLWRDGRLPQHDAGLLISWTNVLEIRDEDVRGSKPDGSSLDVALIDIDWFKSAVLHGSAGARVRSRSG
jgi:hypothetical protein